MRHHILFVDDDRKILDGLRRMLSDRRGEWCMHFAESGQVALGIMASTPVDVVVTDMRMPGMDGADLLCIVQREHPEVVRIVLSGYTERESLDRVFPPSHQFLSKPCPREVLVSTIDNALNSRSLLRSTGLRALVGSIAKLPSLPEIFRQVSAEIAKEEPSIDRLGAIIGQDVAMTARLLKLVNSPFFGLSRKILSPVQAVNLVGINYLQSLILACATFDACEVRIPGYSLRRLMEHSLRTSCATARIAALEGVSAETRDEFMAAGLLHDIGKLVLATNMPEPYAHIIETVRREARPVHEVEFEVLGATHAEMGAYLLRLWGLPDSVVDAALLHHAPCTLEPTLNPSLAVYCANVLDRELMVINPGYRKPSIDDAYLKRSGLAQRLEAWKAELENVCRTVEGDEAQDTDC